MKVTIITTCLNRVDFIHEAIRSVLAQDYPEIEYIIVDGASNDGSKEAIEDELNSHQTEEWKNAHPKFTFKFICEPDHSVYEALNKGIKVATGDIIGLVHSDDFLYNNNTISSIVEEFKKTGADFIYANGLYVDYDNPDKIVRNWKSSRYSKAKIRRAWLPLHTTCYIKREKMLEIGPYNEKYKIASDTDFLIRALYEHSYNVRYLDRYVITMRMGGMSTNMEHIKLMWSEDVAIFAEHGFPPVISKTMKMMRKIPQFVTAKFFTHRPHKDG